MNDAGMADRDWDRLELDLCRHSLPGPESLRLSVGNAFLPGVLLPAPGRALPGWETEACEALIVERLAPAGYQTVGGIIPGSEMVDDVDSATGSPVIGGIWIRHRAHEILLVVRIDDAAEIYARISATSHRWPPEE